MSAPYWNLRAKVQDAVAAYLVSASSGEFIASDDWAGSPTLIPVRVGFTADLIEKYPMIAVIADKSGRYLPDAEVSQIDNTRLVALRVVVRTAAEQWNDASSYTAAEDQHGELVAKVMDLLNQDDILVQLAAVGIGDLTIQQFDLMDESSQVNENNLETTQEIFVVAIPQ